MPPMVLENLETIQELFHKVESDPSVVATPFTKGTLICYRPIVGLPTYYVKQDSILSTNVVAIGGGGGGVTAVGAIDSLPKVADGAQISGTDIYFQTADGGFPGMLSLAAQNIVGEKSFSQPVSFFDQAVPPPIAAGGTVTAYSDAADNLLKTVDASGEVRVMNSILQEEGVDTVIAPKFLNFVGAGVTVIPNGVDPLGADIQIPGGGGIIQERFTAPGGLTAPQIGTGAPVLGDGVILPHTVDHNSVICNLQGSGLLFEGVGFDYTLDDVINPGFTTVIFDAALVPFLVVGQNFQVQYSH
jgi:hypothetical protein